MKFIVKIGIETDGDFRLDRYESLFSMEHPKGSTEYYKEYYFEDNDMAIYNWEEGYYLKQFDARWRVAKLLEEMLVNFRVAPSHYYMLDYLYHMFEDAKNKLWNREKHIETFISGNYEGTYIEIIEV